MELVHLICRTTESLPATLLPHPSYRKPLYTDGSSLRRFHQPLPQTLQLGLGSRLLLLRRRLQTPVLCQFCYRQKEWVHLFFQSGFHLLLILKISPNHSQNQFLRPCIYKNGQKNRAKTGHFSVQFLPSNHNILWFIPSNSSLFHNTASLLLPQRAPSLGTYPPLSPA